MQVAAFLEDIPMFGHMSSSQILSLARMSRIMTARAGTVIFRQGSDGDDVYVLRRGYVRLLREVKMQSSHKQRFNSLTHSMLGLRETLEVLSPRRGRHASPRPHLEVHQRSAGLNNCACL
jgi:hypothetical protein